MDRSGEPLQAARRDPVAVYPDWESVYRADVTRVYRLVFRRVGNAADAEDLTEEVMVRTLRTLHFPAAAREVRSYLVKTIRSVLSEHFTRHYGEPPDLDRLDRLEGSHLHEVPDREAAARRAAELLALLPERSRRLLELRFLEGRSLREAAAAMGISVANAKVIQFRALRQAAELSRQSRR